MRSFAISLLLITYTFAASGQTFQELRNILQEQKFNSLINFIKRSSSTNNIIPSWDLLRQIHSDYQEGVIRIDSPSQLEIYRIDLIASKDQIIFYKVNKKVCRPNLDCTFVPEEIFKDTAAYAIFESSFRSTYNASIDTSDLFQTSIIYGQHCGIAGVNPKYLQKLNTLIESGDIEAIRSWLRSSNAEKQLYAVRGYKYLTLTDYKLTDEDERLLKIVKQKKGEVNTCSGCLFGTDRFEQIIYEIDSESVASLKPEKEIKDLHVEISKNKKTYPFLTTIGMTLLFFIGLYNFYKYFRVRETNK